MLAGMAALRKISGMAVIYIYKNCDQCRKAVKWLATHDLKAEEKPIRETPPTPEELGEALKKLGRSKIFNVSGADYRQMGLKDRLPGMTDAEVVELLASNGNLVKRPFFFDGQTILAGFNEADWKIKLF